jgi:hypothetical protein
MVMEVLRHNQDTTKAMDSKVNMVSTTSLVPLEAQEDPLTASAVLGLP